MGIGEVVLWVVVIVLVLDRFPNLLVVLLIVWLLLHQQEVITFFNHHLEYHNHDYRWR